MIALFARPLGGLLKFVYQLVGGLDGELISAYAIAIIITTILFKLILLPLGLKQAKSMKKMQEIQPKMNELKEKYKNDPQTMQAKTMELYKENNANPFSSCLPLLIQMPIIIAFFNVLRNPVLYVFGTEAAYAEIGKAFLWIPNLENPDPYLWGLPLLAGLTTYLQSKLMAPPTGNPQAESTTKTMNMIFPVMIFWMSRSFPAGLALYWVVGNIFQIVQQYITNRSLGKVKEVSR